MAVGPRLYSYMITDRGTFLSLCGPTREAEAARWLGKGARYILTWDFSQDATDEEIVQFLTGVRCGYTAALAAVRTVLMVPGDNT